MRDGASLSGGLGFVGGGAMRYEDDNTREEAFPSRRVVVMVRAQP